MLPLSRYFHVSPAGISGTANCVVVFAATVADEQGLASLRDLHLAPGPVGINVTGGPPEGPSPYVLTPYAIDISSTMQAPSQ